MDEYFYKNALLMLLFLFLLVRAPYVYKSNTRKTVVKKKSATDCILLVLTTAGIAILPLVYTTSSFLDAFSIPIPDVLHIAGGAVYLAALVLMLLVLRELGSNWSMGVELKEEHRLITSGPYRFVRHPMYTAFTLMMIGQLFLTANWLVGGFGIVAWVLFCIVRIPREEGMMTEEFGDAYQAYAERTWSIMPEIGHR